ncbi:MAG: bis-aminopropyl spermidine synthase family protein, partial [Streptosporangiaceae bacterium]
MAPDEPPGPESGPAGPLSALDDLVARQRPGSRRLRRAIALLTEQPLDLASLVQQSGLARPTAEALLAAAAGDLVHSGAAAMIQPGKVAVYRQRFGYEQLKRTELTDPLPERLADAKDIVESMTGLVAGAPPAKMDLDHVPAIPETAVRRALWLDSTYDLPGTVLLCVGDHDPTSLAVAQVSPGVTVVVVDIDEATLE